MISMVNSGVRLNISVVMVPVPREVVMAVSAAQEAIPSRASISQASPGAVGSVRSSRTSSGEKVIKVVASEGSRDSHKARHDSPELTLAR